MAISIKKSLILSALAVLMSVSIVAPARADWDDRGHYRHYGWAEHGRRMHRWYAEPVVVVAPPPVVYVQPQPVAAPLFPFYGMNAVLHIR